MDVSTIVELIERLGVPVVVLLFAGWYVKWLQEGFDKEREAMRSQEGKEEEQLISLVKASSDALLEMKMALAEQTATMRELLGRLDTRR